MALTPTLFVGLGSTGSRVLKKLREYIHATYLTRDLPIFQFLVIETAPEEGEPFGDRSWRFFRGDPADFNSARESALGYEWLRITDLLKGHKFDSGAGNVRTAGRLYLWQNWVPPEGHPAPPKRIKRIIDEAYEATKLEKNADTIDYLEKYYMERRKISRENLPKPIVEDSTRVFVVGTFCGGTASGMLWDICFYLRQRVYGTTMQGQGKRIQGIFTIPDVDFANRSGANYPQHAANTWASLHELDYFSRATTTYQVLFPGMATAWSTTEPPFDHFLVVSPSSNRGRIAASDAHAIAALNEIVALHLFCQTVDKFQATLQATHVDWPLDNGLHPTSTRLRFLSTFGLSGVVYPKYNIAAAAASMLSREVCKKWQSPPAALQKASVEDYAAAEWSGLMGEVDRPGSTSQTTLLQQAREFIETAIGRLNFGEPNWATDLEISVNGFFGKGARWRRLVESRVADWQTNLKGRAAEMIAAAFEQYDNLPQTNVYIDALTGRISQDTRNPERFPTQEPEVPAIAPLLRPVMEAASNPWVKGAGAQRKAVEYHRSRALRIYRNKLEDFVHVLTNHFAKSAVEDLCNKILPTLRSRLNDENDGVPKLIRDISIALQGMVNDYTNFVTPPNVRLVTAATLTGRKAGIETEAQNVCKALTPKSLNGNFSSVLMGRLRKFEVEEFKNFSAKAPATELIKRFLDSCIAFLDEKSNLTSLIQSLGPEGVNAVESAADPYLEWPSQQLNVKGARALACVFGSTPNNGAALGLLRSGTERARVDDTVDHMVLFYNETFGFAVDDTAVRVQLENQFEEKQQEASRFSAGRFTHKDGLEFFGAQRAARAAEVERWATVAVDIVPEAFRDARGELVFGFTRRGLVDEVDLTSHADRARFSTKAESGTMDHFVEKVKQALAALGHEEAARRVNELTRPLRDAGQRKEATERADFYDKLFEGFFPPGKRIEKARAKSNI